MNRFGINIQEWLRSAFEVSVANASPASPVKIRHLSRRRRHRHHSRHSRCVYLEFVNLRAHRVAIAGSFNDWRPSATPMVPMGRGWWVKGLVLPPGRHEYRLVVDGREMPDPNAAQTTRDGEGRVSSVVVVPETTNT